ncbi:kinesin light chain [Ceratobasidium sp. AG-Ba]|nr:kinesin light chain [Ceratobasidium sp. AG-Ba]
MSKHNMNAGIPTIFRSYPSANDPSPKCTIWQALRASTAHPEMFESIGIEEHGISQLYVDAAMGCGNPMEHVLTEAKRMYPNGRVACVVSIGGGHARTIQIPKPSALSQIFPIGVITAMRDIAMDNERTAQMMAKRFQETPNVYFRLNVDQGIQAIKLGNYDRLSDVMAHTRAYISKVETNDLLRRASIAIRNEIGVIPTKCIDGEIQLDLALPPSNVKDCPTPTSVYTDRHGPLQAAIGCLTDNTLELRVFVFHGLGGAGKTQLALQTVQRTWDHWSDVVYINASSTETLTSTLKDFAVTKKIGHNYQDALQWLGKTTSPWLMIFDNADNSSIGFQNYFPKGAGGRIILTTRAREVALLSRGPDSEYNVSSLEADEAYQLLLAVARPRAKDLSKKEKDAAVLLIQVELVLVRCMDMAGAYIWRTSCGFYRYREIYSAQPQRTLEKYNNVLLELSGYEKTVYGTWVMSYQSLSKRAQRMLWLISYLQRDKISAEIFRRAATRVKKFKPKFPLTDIMGAIFADLEDYLTGFLVRDKWNLEAFQSLMGEIISYSLISYDRMDATYALHVLVQGWVKTVVPYQLAEASAQACLLLILSIDHEEGSQDYSYR